MEWHRATETPKPDTEVLAEVKGFKHNRFIILRWSEEGWWQHIPRMNDIMPSDGWVGTHGLFVIRWAYIDEKDLELTPDDVPKKGYDPDYLQSCINKAKKSWEGVDVDEFMDDVRGHEPVRDCHGLAEEIDAVSKRYPEVSFAKLSRIAKHFAEWQKQQDFKDFLKSDNTNLVKCYEKGKEDQKAEDEQKCQGCFDRDEVFWKGMQHAKEEWMKEAVEGIVVISYIDRDGVSYCNIVSTDIPTEKYGIEEGSKCKCLILKDDETESN